MTRRRLLAELGVLSVLIAVYFVAGKLGLTLAFVNASASPVWPPAGLALAALLLLGYRVWPAIFVGAYLVNLKFRHLRSPTDAECIPATRRSIFQECTKDLT